MEAQVLEKNDLTILGLAACFLNIRSNAVVLERHFLLEIILECGDDWREGILLLWSAIWSSHMTH